MQGQTIIQRYTKRWQFELLVEAVLYGLGIGMCAAFILRNSIAGIIIGGMAIGIIMLVLRPWKITEKKVSSYIDQHLNTSEYSTSLLLSTSDTLTSLAQLQQQKITEVLRVDIQRIKPQTGVKRALITAILLVGIGLLVFSFYQSKSANLEPNATTEKMFFSVTDSVVPTYEPPVLLDQKLVVRYPGYTDIGTRTAPSMSAKVLEGSQLFWELEFDSPVSSVVIEGFEAQKIKMNPKVQNVNLTNTTFTKNLVPKNSGYYNFRFIDTLGTEYASEIYAIEVFKDKPPVVEIKGIQQFTSFDYSDVKELNFTTQLTDDFGLSEATIIATVSKGSGESVKFREEKLTFDRPVVSGIKASLLSKKINLDALKMELGDELYFYVEARDQKTPRVNITRSETFFAVIRDTVSDGFGVEGTLGADLMPDYFRSQRQLIIDTEKLIKERTQITEQELTSRSNELGFDQKSLRLKYGQFMGDEADSGIAVTPEIDVDDFDPEDPTAGFRHDHDSENEHNLVDDDHQGHDHGEGHAGEEGEEGEEESPLEKYVHNHDDPEESTLFTASLRSKLKMAMAQMWDAELYLRLATPEKSLPYQYKALELIQEIKNSARIYVHRIGFDPPPIKEDKRLSGDLDEINTLYKQDDIEKRDLFKAMRRSISILENQLSRNQTIDLEDKEIFTKAGEELTLLAIKEPSKHLKTLQNLKWLTEDKKQDNTILRSVQKGLLQALPEKQADPSIREHYRSVLEKVFIQELKASDE